MTYLRALLLVGIFSFSAHAQETAALTDTEKLFGLLPKPGNISDILDCAGANEVFWTTKMKEDPYDFEANEAKRKAGWYAAVALWVFAVDSQAVVDAVNSARKRQPREVFELARQCRKAPENWRK